MAKQRKSERERDEQHARLCGAIKHSRKALEHARQRGLLMTQQYVGMHVFTDGSNHPVPVNALGTFIDIRSRSLVSRNPAVLYDTDNMQARPYVKIAQGEMNDRIRDSDIGETLHRIVVDSLIYPVGIAYVALTDPIGSAQLNYNVEVGDAHIWRIAFDDFAYDIHSSTFAQADFIAHRFRPHLDAAREMYGKQLEPVEPSDYNEQGDRRASSLGRGDEFGESEYEPRAELWSVFCPRHKVIKILDSNLGGDPEESSKPLAEIPWVGPDHGPYIFLGYHPIPGSALFKPPCSDLFDLHLDLNNVYRKVIQQTRNQKRVTLFAGLQDEEIETINQLPDGGSASVQTLQGVQTQDMNGPNAAAVQMAVHIRDMFSRQAGNLDTEAGLRSQAKTMGQESMMAQQSGMTVAAQQETAVHWVSKVIRARAWYRWKNPDAVIKHTSYAAGMREVSSTGIVTPMQRFSIPWEETRLTVDPYSLPHSSPGARARDLTQIMTQVVMPMLPVMLQQGEAPKLRLLMEKYADYLNLPELREIFQTVLPPAEKQAGGGMEEPGKPPVTTREYQRFGAGEDSAASEEADMLNAMAAAGEPQQGKGQ